LEDIGEPALAALRRAATSREDLEIRQRAERIIHAIAARAADAIIKRQLAAVKGKWTVEFTNGVTEVCRIGKDGEASVEEPLRRSDGTAVVQGGSVVITFQDDRVERWTAVGKRVVVEHWFPGARFPTAPPALGIATRTP
jgi:hypothetical protein